MAKIFKARLCLLHVIEPTAVAGGDSEDLPAGPAQFDLIERAKGALDIPARSE
jgi:hypothetical protein